MRACFSFMHTQTNIGFYTLTMSTHAHRTHEHIFGLVYSFLFAFVRCVFARAFPFMCDCLFDGTSCLLCIHQLTHNGEHTTIELVSMKPNIARAHFGGNRKYYIYSFALSLNRSLRLASSQYIKVRLGCVFNTAWARELSRTSV